MAMCIARSLGVFGLPGNPATCGSGNGVRSYVLAIWLFIFAIASDASESGVFSGDAHDHSLTLRPEPYRTNSKA